MEDEGEHDREHDPLLDPHADDDRGGDGGDGELVLPHAPNRAHARDVDELEADQEDDGRQHRIR